MLVPLALVKNEKFNLLLYLSQILSFILEISYQKVYIYRLPHMYTMDELISVRIPKQDLKEVELISEEEKRKKSEILREILFRGIMEMKLQLALKKYQNNEATAWKAAGIAGIPLTKFMDILAERNINFHYGVEELKEDIKNIEKYDI